MIKVNLGLQKKASSVAQSEKTSGGMKGLRNVKFDADTLSGLPIRQMVIAFGVAMAAGYVLDDYKAEEMARVEGELSAAQAQLDQLRAQNGKLRQIFAVKDQLDADEKVLRAKIDTIKFLISDRENPPRMMRTVSQSLPENLWLREFFINGQNVQFSGSSMDFNEISDFMQSLQTSAYFGDVELKGTEEKDESGLMVKQFDVTAKRK